MDIPVEDSVGFMNIPLSAQALWFHLCIRAEWDGLYYRINRTYARDIREAIGATAADVRELLRNQLILEYDGYIYLENVTVYPGPVVVNEAGMKEVSILFPGSRLEICRERVSKYRRASVFDFENS